MRRAPATALVAVAAALGCSSMSDYTSVGWLKDAKYEPTTEVEIFDQKPPSRAYDVIAKLQTRMGPDIPIGDLYTSMREKAREIGADGVIDVQESVDTNMEYDGGIPMIGLGGGMSTEKTVTLTGKAIKYK
jgi:hypothetical protein